jgi:hypothetical protein
VATIRFTWQSAIARALMGVFGGFVLALCFMVGTASGLVAAGWMSRADASITAGMLAFVVWVGAVLGAFAADSVRCAAKWGCGCAAGFAFLGWVCLHG